MFVKYRYGETREQLRVVKHTYGNSREQLSFVEYTYGETREQLWFDQIYIRRDERTIMVRQV